MPFGRSIEEWIIVAAAIIFRLVSGSETLTWKQRAATVSGALISAVVGTPLLADLFAIEAEAAHWLIAGLLALTGEELLRQIILRGKDGSLLDGILKRAGLGGTKGDDK